LEVARFTGILIGSPGVPKLNVEGSIPFARFEVSSRQDSQSLVNRRPI
jgi:hypothetical protein